MPIRPQHVNEIISKYIKAKVPHFFIYAKDKEKKNVEDWNGSVVNTLEHVVPNKRINFVKIAGKFNYKMLMRRTRIKLDDSVIEAYVKLDKNKKKIANQRNELKSNDKLYAYKFIRSELLSINDDIDYITDVLVKYLYGKKNSKHKTTLWESFGDVIIKNLERNLESTKQCEECGCRIERMKAKRFCLKCAENREIIRMKNRSKKLAENKI